MGKAIKDQLGRIIKRQNTPQPAVILVRPQLGENIGAACRGMLNFGLTELRLVAPRDGWPNPAANAMAAGAVELIENAKLFATVDEAVADLSFVMAATARRRELEIPVVGTDVVGKEMRAKVEQGVGILFGPEKAGLTNADVVLADKILTYPVNPAFQSLNLAQAVNVFAFIWAQSGSVLVPDIFEDVRSEVAPREDLTRLFDHLEEELEKAGFFFPAAKKTLMQNNIRAPLTRAQMSEQEVRTFRGIVKALAKGRGKGRSK